MSVQDVPMSWITVVVRRLCCVPLYVWKCEERLFLHADPKRCVTFPDFVIRTYVVYFVLTVSNRSMNAPGLFAHFIHSLLMLHGT